MRPIFQHIDLFLSELLGQLQGVDDFIVLFIAAVGGHAQGLWAGEPSLRLFATELRGDCKDAHSDSVSVVSWPRCCLLLLLSCFKVILLLGLSPWARTAEAMILWALRNGMRSFCTRKSAISVNMESFMLAVNSIRS